MGFQNRKHGCDKPTRNKEESDMIEFVKEHFFRRESAKQGNRQSASQRRREFYESIADGYGLNLAEGITSANF